MLHIFVGTKAQIIKMAPIMRELKSRGIEYNYISSGQHRETIDELIDRPLEQLDPIELAVLLIGVYELESRIDVPYKVVINEGVNLAKRFGATDSHKYINACLDTASQSLRSIETGG